MTRNRLSWIALCALCFIVFAMISGCAKPTKEMEQAESAIESAKDQGAERYEPQRIADAEKALEQGKVLMDDGDYQEARDKFQKAYRLALTARTEPGEGATGQQAAVGQPTAQQSSGAVMTPFGGQQPAPATSYYQQPAPQPAQPTPPPAQPTPPAQPQPPTYYQQPPQTYYQAPPPTYYQAPPPTYYQAPPPTYYQAPPPTYYQQAPTCSQAPVHGYSVRPSYDPYHHIVASGETLFKISGYSDIYNDPYQWPIIYDANRYAIDTEAHKRGVTSAEHNHIYPGQNLAIPRSVTTEEIRMARQRAGAPEPYMAPGR